MTPYSLETIEVMPTFYNTLSEKDKEWEVKYPSHFAELKNAIRDPQDFYDKRHNLTCYAFPPRTPTRLGAFAPLLTWLENDLILFLSLYIITKCTEILRRFFN